MKDVVKATGSFLTKMKISQLFGGFGYYILEKKADLWALTVENIYKRVHKWVNKCHVVVASKASYTQFTKRSSSRRSGRTRPRQPRSWKAKKAPTAPQPEEKAPQPEKPSQGIKLNLIMLGKLARRKP